MRLGVDLDVSYPGHGLGHLTTEDSGRPARCAEDGGKLKQGDDTGCDAESGKCGPGC